MKIVHLKNIDNIQYEVNEICREPLANIQDCIENAMEFIAPTGGIEAINLCMTKLRGKAPGELKFLSCVVG